MKKLKCVIFDFNGTLLFDSKFHIESFNRYLEKAGKPTLSKEELIRSVFGRPNSELYKKYFNPNANDDEIELFAKEKEQKYVNNYINHPETVCFPEGVEEMLDFLKKSGIPYAIATGSDKINVDFYLEHLKIDRWFSYDNIFYNDGSFRGKPAPDIYQLTAKKLGFDPSECLIFEDAKSGILSANAANAGAVISIHEPSIPSGVDDDVKVSLEISDFLDFKSIFKKFGLI